MAPKLVDHFDVPLDPGVRREAQPLLVPWFHVEFFDGVNGTVSPPDYLSYPSFATLETPEGHLHGPSIYSVLRGSDGNLSYTSVSYAQRG